ncbi:MAG: 5-formyltetrahydrofolate cyclo-ligase [Burkholderiales bacterium]|nr:5-formyltetrahydrofolate cyclo-ligase [Phycisphaerae bacterium]
MDQEAKQNFNKAEIRRTLRELLANMTPASRHTKSVAACALISATPEFQAARTVMLYLSTPLEVDTAPLALRAWQHGKTVVVPKVSWDAKRMVPVEIASLSSDQLRTTDKGIREPVAGNPVPLSFIDLVVVPGLGFTEDGHRIGRGMGFYDIFLAQHEFLGVSCGLSFEEQIVPFIPMLDHDVTLGMLATDRGIRRVAMPHIAR